MIVEKTKNKMKYKWYDIVSYYALLIFYYLAFLMPFPFMWLYGVCVDFGFNKPIDPRYEYNFIPEHGEVVDEFGNDYYYK